MSFTCILVHMLARQAHPLPVFYSSSLILSHLSPNPIPKGLSKAALLPELDIPLVNCFPCLLQDNKDSEVSQAPGFDLALTPSHRRQTVNVICKPSKCCCPSWPNVSCLPACSLPTPHPAQVQKQIIYSLGYQFQFIFPSSSLWLVAN